VLELLLLDWALHSCLGGRVVYTEWGATRQRYRLCLDTDLFFQLATRHSHNPQALYLLTGLANRKAQAMGLHREGSLKGVSPFETEMRRRLWWQILIMDNRSAELSGAVMCPQLYSLGDTKQPSNVNDSDLDPSMRELPRDHVGITEMLFCSMRFEIGKCIRRLKGLEQNGELAGMTTSVADQDKIVDELEKRLEEGYLKYCDPSIPLHQLAINLGRSAVWRLRISTHRPRQNANQPQEEKDMLFALGLQVILYDNLTHSTKSLEGYLWHVVIYFPYDVFILVLKELLTRVEGEGVDRAWTLINHVYEDHAELCMTESRNALHCAVGNLAIKAWDKRAEAARQHQQPYHPWEPAFISKLRARKTLKSRHSQAASQPAHPEQITHAANTTSLDLNNTMLDHQAYFPMDPTDWDWDYWQNLIDGRIDPFNNDYEQHFQ
jgi:Fungal specific transcription factor domain